MDAVTTLRDTATRLHELDLVALSDIDLHAVLTELGCTQHTIAVVLGRAMAETDRRESCKALGYARAADLVANTSPLNVGQAREIDNTNRSVVSFAAVSDALDGGLISGPHAKMIGRFLKTFGHRIPEQDRSTVTAALLAVAAAPHSQELKDHIKTLKDELRATDDPKPAGEDHELDEFEITRGPDGRAGIVGNLSQVATEMLLTALSSLNQPRPGEQRRNPRLGACGRW